MSLGIYERYSAFTGWLQVTTTGKGRILSLAMAIGLSLLSGLGRESAWADQRKSPASAKLNETLPRKLGLELEYALSPRALRQLSQVDQAKALLDGFPDATSGIKAAPWDEFKSSRPLWRAEVRDQKGRIWSSVPEQANSDQYDGRELVTPPMEFQTDLELLEAVRGKIESSVDFTIGRRSSIHFNYDVSDLIDARGDARRLVNVILFLEQHWPEIYRLVRPRRYNSVVNYYALPLSANQPDLLAELAALPDDQRTYARVRKIFLAHAQKELYLMDDNKVRMWKFRAANYGKLFVLSHPQQVVLKGHLPIIEIRISDMVEMSRVRRLNQLFTSIIDYAAHLPPIREFQSPFPDFPAVAITQESDLSELNTRIQSLPFEQIQDFVRLALGSSCAFWL